MIKTIREGDMHEGISDMQRLNDVHEASLLHTLRTRLNDDTIYTWTGPILISVNPYFVLPLYGTDKMKKYDPVHSALTPWVLSHSLTYNIFADTSTVPWRITLPTSMQSVTFSSTLVSHSSIPDSKSPSHLHEHSPQQVTPLTAR
jgi:hypothetical protein